MVQYIWTTWKFFRNIYMEVSKISVLYASRAFNLRRYFFELSRILFLSVARLYRSMHHAWCFIRSAASPFVFLWTSVSWPGPLRIEITKCFVPPTKKSSFLQHQFARPLQTMTLPYFSLFKVLLVVVQCRNGEQWDGECCFTMSIPPTALDVGINCIVRRSVRTSLGCYKSNMFYLFFWEMRAWPLESVCSTTLYNPVKHCQLQ